MQWTAKLDGHDIVATGEQLDAFKQAYVGGDLASRMSDLLTFDMYVLDAAFGVSPHEVLSAIKNVEDGEPHNPQHSSDGHPCKGFGTSTIFQLIFWLKTCNWL
jgi:hypothetical protein